MPIATTMEMKYGRYEAVCVKRWYQRWRISLRTMAKTMGTGNEKMMVETLRRNVLRTRRKK